METLQESINTKLKKTQFQNLFFEYLDLGLQPIPIYGIVKHRKEYDDPNSKKKKPDEKAPVVTSWTGLQSDILTMEEADKYLDGKEVRGSRILYEVETPGAIGIITGKVSGNLEVIDIDIKHDPDKKIGIEYFDLIKSNLPELYDKLTIQQTPTDGFHIIYRCPFGTIAGSHKLAFTQDGKHATIETRGERGYIVATPSTTTIGTYKIIQGGLDSIPVITPEQRTMLLGLAKGLTRFKPQEAPPYEYQQKEKKKTTTKDYDITSLEDYDQRGNPLEVLTELNWTIVESKGPRTYLLRPTNGSPSTAKSSANYHHEFRTLTIFSSSVSELDDYQTFRRPYHAKNKTLDELEADRTLSPSAVYCFFKCKGDWSATAKELGSLGYGKRKDPDEEDIEDLGDELRVKVKNGDLKQKLVETIEQLLKGSSSSEHHKEVGKLLTKAQNLWRTNDLDGVKTLAQKIIDGKLNDEDILDILTHRVTLEEDKETIKNQPPGIDTGYYIGSDKYSLLSGAINTIAGPTGHCKTTFMLNVAYNLVNDYPDKSVLYVSLEQPSWKLRSYLTLLHLNLDDLVVKGSRFDEAVDIYKKNNDLSLINPDYREAYRKGERELYSNYIESGRLRIVDNYSLTDIVTLCDGIRRLKDHHKPGLLVIDYIQQINVPPSPNLRMVNRQEETKIILTDLERLGLDTGIPIALGSQFNRTCRNHFDLIKESLAEAGDIERKSESIIALWNNNIEAKQSQQNPKEALKKISESGRAKEGTLYVTTLKSRVIQPETWDTLPMTIKSRKVHKNPPKPKAKTTTNGTR
jgi:replicative DNA helicase